MCQYLQYCNESPIGTSLPQETRVYSILAVVADYL